MTYTVKDIFLTLQCEGAQAGRKAVFVRLAGCNLWSGRDEDRAGSCSAWCDTDFRGGIRAEADAIAARAAELWGPDRLHRWCVLTGGEPALQVDDGLRAALKRQGFMVAIETNGTRSLPPGLDWVTVSPKALTDFVVIAGDELKVAWPQPLDLDRLALLPFAYHFLQPIDGPDREANTRACVERCLADPRWRLSLQTHKLVGLP
jgi:7-carboxy-7-deazaguanine synthase